MANLTFTIPDDKVATAVEGYLKVHPKKEGSPLTDIQWVKESIRKSICSDIAQGLRMKDKDAIPSHEDDTIVTT